jgi:hypothetical protein
LKRRWIAELVLDKEQFEGIWFYIYNIGMLLAFPVSFGIFFPNVGALMGIIGGVIGLI